MPVFCPPDFSRVCAGLLLSASLLLAACGESGKEVPVVAEQAPQVGVARFDGLRFFPEREAPATVLGKNETRLAAEVSARIQSIAVDVGDEVVAGQVLIRLDARDAELALARADAALAQADARLAQAEAQSKRAAALQEKNFISAEAVTLRDTELAAAVADRRAAAASLATARRGVEKCTLRAPFKAIVRARAGQVGELTSPGTPLLTLADISELQVVAQVQASDADLLEQATRVEFVTARDRLPVQPLRVSSAVHRESRTVEARFGFAPSVAIPAPGSEGRLAWRDTRAHLPPELILRRNGKYGVFVVAEGVARFHELPAAQEGRPAAVTLPDAAEVAVQGRHALQDGMRVRLAEKP
ncbi:MAG: efflux RND transporter periplasmic adaptor subunit [Zoogloeaceae bacterium]|nr:efflux RND transporter periplasmic adaptor subunit [Zoogloeaceae bacterium]